MSKAGITRTLPENEYQAAINANNPSALNPFLTESDFGAGLGGSVNIPLPTVTEAIGTANSGISLDQNMLIYSIEGVGGPVVPGSKASYWQFVVPAGYSGGGQMEVIVSTNSTITGFAMTARINGAIDSTINAVDLNTAVTYPTFEKQTYVFGDTLTPGDIITISIIFAGQLNMDAYIRGIDFDYNIDIL
jgi:hypothetical protein